MEPIAIPSLKNGAWPFFKAAASVMRAQMKPLFKAVAQVLLPILALYLASHLTQVWLSTPPLAKPNSSIPGYPKASNTPPPPRANTSARSYLFELLAPALWVAEGALLLPVCVHVAASHFIGERAESRGAVKAARTLWRRVAWTLLARSSIKSSVNFVTCMLTNVAAVLAILVFSAGEFLAHHTSRIAGNAEDGAMATAICVGMVSGIGGGATITRRYANGTTTVMDCGKTASLGTTKLAPHAALWTHTISRIITETIWDPKTHAVVVITVVVPVIVSMTMEVFFVFSPEIASMEAAFGFAAIGRSFRLSKGHRWTILLPILVSSALLNRAIQISFVTIKPKDWALLAGMGLSYLPLKLTAFVLKVWLIITVVIMYFSARQSLADTSPKTAKEDFGHNSLSEFVHGNVGKSAQYAPVPQSEEVYLLDKTPPQDVRY